MSYVQHQLLPGEQVKYRAHLSKVFFLPAYLLIVATVVVGVVIAVTNQALWPFAALLALVTLVIFIFAWIRFHSSEFAVTDRRVIVKVGWLNRRTLETMLGKVEAISVDQSMMGRMLNYGDITVTGTGGTKETFHRISLPLEFRKHVQGEAIAADDRRSTATDLVTGIAAQEPREERECPFCAERILVRAKMCRFCGRDVPPAG